jgi:prephenate dehydrogenase
MRLANSAPDVWHDALQSQVRLTQYIDQLQIQVNEIKQYTAVPAYCAGLKRLQAGTTEWLR